MLTSAGAGGGSALSSSILLVLKQVFYCFHSLGSGSPPLGSGSCNHRQRPNMAAVRVGVVYYSVSGKDRLCRGRRWMHT